VATPKFRCSRSTFTKAEYQQNVDRFYPMPTTWGDGTGRPALSTVWHTGGVGAISSIPVLGLYAHAEFAGEVRLPIEKVARLIGADDGTVRKGAVALHDLGLASSRPEKRHGKRLTCWAVRPALSVPRRGSRLDPDYFFFSARLIFGGNWAALTGPQRAVYLALATRAATYKEQPAEIGWLRHALRAGTPWDDLERCAATAGSRGLRLASVSLDDLSTITGLALSTVKTAVRGLKHPSAWPGTHNPPGQLRHSPLAVYPSDGGNLIYHFRDHARPWPFEEEPAGESATADPPPAACPADQPEPVVERRIDPVFAPNDDDEFPEWLR
jgi:hypothetical protein